MILEGYQIYKLRVEIEGTFHEKYEYSIIYGVGY